MNWNIADAKNRLSELFNLTLSEGPQRITRRDQIVIVMNEAEYNRLSGLKPSFGEMLLNGPGFEGMPLERDRSPVRSVIL